MPDDPVVFRVGSIYQSDPVAGGDSRQAADASTQIGPDFEFKIRFARKSLEHRHSVSGNERLDDADFRGHRGIVSPPSMSPPNPQAHSVGRADSQGVPRVVVIYHFYPHYRRAIVEALARSTRASFVFVGDEQEYLRSVEPARLGDFVRFHRAPARHLFGPFMWQWGAIRWAVSSRFDTVIMHAVPHWPCTWIGGMLARLLGKHVIFWGHGYLQRPRGLKGLIRKLFYAIPTDHLLYSRLSKAYAIETGWDPARLHVIYNSLDAAEQKRVRDAWSPAQGRELRERTFGDADTPVIGCTSRLIPMRRLHELLRAVAFLRDQGLRCNILLIGDGPERDRLERLASELKLQVHFAGAVYDEARLGSMLMACRVTVSPGKTGLTVVHSIGYGVPVISHDDSDDQGPEWEAIIPGRTGSFFRTGDIASLASAVRPWVEGPERNPRTVAACLELYDRFWNPDYQRLAIERAVCGEDADDLMSPGAER